MTNEVYQADPPRRPALGYATPPSSTRVAFSPCSGLRYRLRDEAGYANSRGLRRPHRWCGRCCSPPLPRELAAPAAPPPPQPTRGGGEWAAAASPLRRRLGPRRGHRRRPQWCSLPCLPPERGPGSCCSASAPRTAPPTPLSPWTSASPRARRGGPRRWPSPALPRRSSRAAAEGGAPRRKRAT